MEVFVYKGLYNLPSIDFECLQTIVRKMLNNKLSKTFSYNLFIEFRVLFV